MPRKEEQCQSSPYKKNQGSFFGVKFSATVEGWSRDDRYPIGLLKPIICGENITRRFKREGLGHPSVFSATSSDKDHMCETFWGHFPFAVCIKPNNS